MAKKTQEKKEEKVVEKKPKVYIKEDTANLKSGLHRVLDVDKVYLTKYDEASGKEIGAYKLSDVLDFIGLNFK